MNYKALFQAMTSSATPIKVGLIGTGAFGKSFLFQARAIDQLIIPVVCDRELAIAHQACLAAGLPETALALCHTLEEAQAALAAGKTALIEDGQLMMALPIDVVVEATGMPDAGALHGKLALEAGKHVVMVNKETDVVVGPILTKLAGDRNLVYTQADGDQPSMLIGLISWAETLGLDLVCAGKASEQDFVYDQQKNTIRYGKGEVTVSGNGVWDLWDMPAGQARSIRSIIEARHQALKSIRRVAVSNLCEMAVVINATGYGYDTPTLHTPVARISEMPEVLRPRAAGGLLEEKGVIDVVNCLRRTDEISFAGGVFVVVRCEDQATWTMLKAKGHIVSRDGTHALIFQPYHLLGVETATTILSAGLLNLPTGGIDVKPRVTLGLRTTDSLPAGHQLLMDSGHAIPGAIPELLPAIPIAPDNAIPFYIAAQNRLKTNAPAGTLLTYDMVDYDADSPLSALKRLQDEVFLG